MTDQTDQVLVGNGWFEAEAVFERDREGEKQVQGGAIVVSQ